MKCWYCGLTEMEQAPDLGSAWLRCPKCGATWTKVPKLAASPLGGIYKDDIGLSHYRPGQTRKPKKAKK